jgi:hypothetical protein
MSASVASVAWHFGFDLLACLAALIIGLWQRKSLRLPPHAPVGKNYMYVLVSGSIVGGYGFGTWNLTLSGQAQLAHSILGALIGAIIGIEIYKALRRTQASTGYLYALPFCAGVAVGRIGCFLSGMDDMTFGIASSLPWAVDFGDGIHRHPVQLYEACAMVLLIVPLSLWARHRPASYRLYAFPATVIFYGLQRFLWEFLKPYAPLAGPLNLFHILCLFIIVYGLGISVIRLSHDGKRSA